MKKTYEKSINNSGSCGGEDYMYIPPEQKLDTLKGLFKNPCIVTDEHFFNSCKMPNRFLTEFYSIRKNNSSKGQVRKNKSRIKSHLRKIVLGESPGLNEIRKENNIHFLIRDSNIQIQLEIDHGAQTYSRQIIVFKELSKTLIADIREDFSEFILDITRIPRHLIESAIPDMFKAGGIDSHTDGILYNLDDSMGLFTKQYPKCKDNFVLLFPLLADIIGYLRTIGAEYSNEKPPSITMRPKDRVKNEYFIVAVDSLKDLIGGGIDRKGRLAATRELEYFKKPVFLTNKVRGIRGWKYFKKGFSLPANTLGKKIQSLRSSGFRDTGYEKFRNKNIKLYLPSFVLQIQNEKSKKKYSYIDLPNIRAIFSKFKYLEIYQRKIILWGFLQNIKQSSTPRNLDKHLKIWGIKEDKKHPSRRIKRISECLSVLMRSGLIYGYKFTKNITGKSQILFNMNPYMTNQFIDLSKYKNGEEEDY